MGGLGSHRRELFGNANAKAMANGNVRVGKYFPNHLAKIVRAGQRQVALGSNVGKHDFYCRYPVNFGAGGDIPPPKLDRAEAFVLWQSRSIVSGVKFNPFLNSTHCNLALSLVRDVTAYVYGKNDRQSCLSKIYFHI